ncbi:AraC family transcriptional regulator [Alkaliphilus crotonatoxidans]
MLENQLSQYKVFNPEKEDCPMCDIFNEIFSTYSFQKELRLPEETGMGYCKRIILKPSMEINITNVTLKDTVVLGGRVEHNSLAFCLGGLFPWRLEDNKKEFEMESGECYLFSKMEGNGICRYDQGKSFSGINIQLDQQTIASFFQHVGREAAYSSLDGCSFYKAKYSSAIRLILNEIINCHYRDELKKIYLEGKVLELIAVFLNELIFQREEPTASKLTSSDIEALHRARKILDGNIVSPPTISKLARMVYLNEYKLKIGFKELFEMPVHAYIIDKRMEQARILMEEKKLRVTEAVQRVGYSDASHFAKKFRKKYGINPSELIKGN